VPCVFQTRHQDHITPQRVYTFFVYLGLYTRVSTHLIMACSKGTETETTNPTHARVRTFAWRHVCQGLACLFVQSSFICTYQICVQGEGGEGCVGVAHSVAACRMCEEEKERERHYKKQGITE